MRAIAGLVAGALCATGLLAVPGLAAGSATPTRVVRPAPPVRSLAGAFTPAAADPRLAAVFARGGLTGDFHFTPADTRRDGRGVMVALRVQSNRVAAPERIAATTPAPGLAPITYNVGATVGWKRFALSGDLARVDLGVLPGSREAADVSVSYRATKRFSGRVKAAADRPYGEVAQLVDQPQSYSVDIGGAYKLTRNLDVTAGVRYRSDRERLTRVDDDSRHDSQAAYVGTIFRF